MNIVERYLIENKISKYKFAQECSLPYSTLSDICLGKTSISSCSGETLSKIARALGVSTDELLEEISASKPFSIEWVANRVRPIAKKYMLQGVYVFGSYARKEATEASDVDILVDREGSTIRGTFGLAALKNDLENSIGKNVDLITLQSLVQQSTSKNNTDFVKNVFRERVKIYG